LPPRSALPFRRAADETLRTGSPNDCVSPRSVTGFVAASRRFAREGSPAGPGVARLAGYNPVPAAGRVTALNSREVEAAFSALKRKFGENIRSKNPVAQVNEVLCKLIAYNLTVIVHEMFENGITPAFHQGDTNPVREVDG